MLAALNELGGLGASVLAGIGWDPGLRGLLSVLLGTVILCGSVYLIVATNTGARLGMLISLAGLSGWMVILTIYWTIAPPAIGPTGPIPSWEPVEVIYHSDGVTAVTDVVNDLPDPASVRIATDEILAADIDLAQAVGDDGTLTEIAAEEGGDELAEALELGGWRVVNSADAGEAQAAADELLAEQGLFTDPSEYVKLNVFEIGGKPEREDDDMLTRIRHKIETTVWWKHPTKYAVVQVQPVIPQETPEGEAPPTPVIDEDQPVISVVMVRDLGNQRGTPALYLVISLAFFVIFCLMLHYRDRTLKRHLDEAEAEA